MSNRVAKGYDVGALRAAEFPWTERGDVIYLDNASTGALPSRTVRAMADFNALRAEPHKISDELQFSTIARTRELCAALIGARETEIAVMVNTSYGLNLAARALPLSRGDIVLSFDREFPANVYPWMALERGRGVTFRQLPYVGGLPDEEGLLEEIQRPAVKVVTVGWVSFATGYRVDLERIGAACRERGVYLVVDAIQGLGAERLDVHRCNVDILACGAQKWLLGPWGSGFVYVREELARELEPPVVGWMSVRGSDDFSRMVDYDFRYRDDARRFEMITVPFQDFAGFNASLELLGELGVDAVVSHVRSLSTRIIEWAASRGDDIRLVTPADPSRRAGIVCVSPRDPVAASARLTDAGVAHALREGAIRLSPHCYNTSDEVDRALDTLA